MLFKPWSELPPSNRHNLDDEDDIADDFTKEDLPSFEVVEDLSLDDQTKLSDLVVLPYNLATLIDSLPNTFQKKLISTISIKNNHKTNSAAFKTPNTSDFDDANDTEFNEDQQLYSTDPSKPFNKNSLSLLNIQIQIYQLFDSSNNNKIHFNLITLPYLTINLNDYFLNSLASFLLNYLNPKFILSFAPSILNYDNLINKIYSSNNILSNFNNNHLLLSKLNNFKFLNPPHYISGISASILNYSIYLNKKFNALILALHSDGIKNFEIVSIDSLLLSIDFLSSYFHLNDSQFLIYKKNFLNSTNSFNSINSSSMYI
ncbi:uncharacterized protein ASCRUDRAFT_11145 [Ascoidea rubescens DSM 1968]|uniref:Proteasome assembly chaperone 1 n=1 Tax=Ascoidea rubescens DSM 1968 TaxID=1344418 RepID=A0A1D2VQ64_9ASCO|nr:hypothetical protein ASCRUDRAFT_11145 [Ascoidea rubescens DSM 1968]ODV63695.1 hypothetical protein ASCRUDRAFT_11145 [Ascoidea rubescens DSM 1968]